MDREEVKEKAIKAIGLLISKRVKQLDMNQVAQQIDNVGLQNLIERIYWEGAVICSQVVGKYYLFNEEAASQMNFPDV